MKKNLILGLGSLCMMAADASMISPVPDKQTEQTARKAAVSSTDLKITAADETAHKLAVYKFQNSLSGTLLDYQEIMDIIKKDDIEGLREISKNHHYNMGNFANTSIQVDFCLSKFSIIDMPIIIFAALNGSFKCFELLKQLGANLLTSVSLPLGCDFTIDLDCMAVAVLSGNLAIQKLLQNEGLPLFNNLGVWFAANLVRDCRMFAYLLAQNQDKPDKNKYEYLQVAIQGMIMGQNFKGLNMLKEIPAWKSAWENAGPYLPLESLLFLAARNDAAVIGEELIKKGADINARDNYSNTPLCVAAGNCSIQMAKLLISKGANVNARGSGRKTPLFRALKSFVWHRQFLNPKIDPTEYRTFSFRMDRSLRIAELLLSTLVNNALMSDKSFRDALDYVVAENLPEFLELLISTVVNNTLMSDKSFRDVLDYAVEEDLSEFLELLISKGVDINTKDENGETLLHRAADKNAIKIAELLLSKGANVNLKNKAGHNPLWSAAENNYVEMAELLISKDADVNEKNEDGNTPFRIALRNDSLKLAELLISKGVSLNEKDKRFVSLWHNVKGEEMLRLLISHGADPIDESMPDNLVRKAAELWIEKYGVNGKNEKGRTLLHRAASHSDKKNGEWLISKGADINAKDNYGDTPLHTAVRQLSIDMVKLLLSKGADVNTKNSKGSTPLHLAALRVLPEIGELLISKGADIRAKNNNGETPLDCTKKESNTRSVTLKDKKKMEQLLLPKGQ